MLLAGVIPNVYNIIKRQQGFISDVSWITMVYLPSCLYTGECSRANSTGPGRVNHVIRAMVSGMWRLHMLHTDGHCLWNAIPPIIEKTHAYTYVCMYLRLIFEITEYNIYIQYINIDLQSQVIK
jgi:hypothetical protein